MAQLGTQNAPKMEPQTPLQSNFFHLGGKPENEQQYNGFACFFMSRETPFRLKIGVWTQHVIQLGLQASCEPPW